jgi:type I restriction enzyme M protein
MLLMRRLSDDEKLVAAQGHIDYPVFMAVAEMIGHDKRGNVVYRRTSTGDDVLVEREEPIIEIDQDTGQEVLRTIKVKERRIDDELDEVADAYHSWLTEHQ